MAEDRKLRDDEERERQAGADAERLAKEPEEGIGLCLSGGGYRAMLFHVGALWRLNEAAVLPQLDRVSSVSGGSIAAGVLALNWCRMGLDSPGASASFEEHLVGPIRALGSRGIDVRAGLGGLLWFGSIGEKVAKAYRKHLFGDATLQELPDRPDFVFNATNVQSGALWRFMRRYMRDWRVGEVKTPTVPLATAVAASSAFPPFLSPTILKLEPTEFTPGSGKDLQKKPYTSRVVLTDGGVYDNLGLEPVWKRYKTVLVSDAGGKMAPQPRPALNWLCHTKRVLDLIDNQVRSLRKRRLIASYVDKRRTGAYWGIRTDIANYQLPDAMDCPYSKTLALANVPTRLKAVPAELQERLINWGYAVCDAALRTHCTDLCAGLTAPERLPYDERGL